MESNPQRKRRTYRVLSRKSRAPKLIAASAVLAGCIFASVLTVVASAAPTSRARSYSITDLGTLGGASSSASAINNRGQIVGSSDLSGSAGDHAFLYSRGRMRELLPGSTQSSATDINNRGEVVGSSEFRAFLYRRGQVTEIGFGGASSFAEGINDRGEVVGTAELPAPSFGSHAFLYRHGGITDLTPMLSAFSIAVGVNDRGTVVGWSDSGLGGFAPSPFLWRNGTLTGLDLTPAGDDVAAPSGINNAGEVVGQSNSLATGEFHAVLLSHGNPISLGLGSAISINNRGQVVGQGPGGAFLYQKGTRIDLNSVLPAGSGWVLSFAVDINDRGQIVGGGIHNGAFHAFLLSPSKK
jgi:probable HAF family extracellular repeat protein